MRTSPPSTIERLEDRIAPANTVVTVAFTGGNLNLTGDAGPHGLTFTFLDTNHALITTDATTDVVFNGGAPTQSLEITGPFKALTGTFLGDVDKLTLNGMTFGGDVTIDLGAGNNELDLGGFATKGILKVKGGVNDDTVVFSGDVVSVKKDLSLLLGDGSNTFTTTSGTVKVGAEFTYTGGTGSESLNLGGGIFQIKGGAKFTFGAGAATLGASATSFSVGKNLVLDASAALAGDAVTLGLGSDVTTLGVKGDLAFLGGAGSNKFELVEVGGAKIGGLIDYEGGSGADTFGGTIVELSAKMIKFNGGAGLNGFTPTLYSSTISGGINLTGGSGTDTFTVIAYGGNYGPLVFNPGDGDNGAEAEFVDSTVKSISYTGGAGSDGLTYVGYLTKLSGGITAVEGAGAADNPMTILGGTIGGAIKLTSTATAADTVSLSFNGIAASANAKIGGIEFDSGNGQGKLDFSDSQNLTFTGLIHVTGGAAADKVLLDTVNLVAKKGIQLDLGGGGNSVTGDFTGLTTKSLAITADTGNDTVTLTGAGNLGALSLHLGAGANAASISQNSASLLRIASVDFTSLSGAAETDAFTLLGVQVAGKFNATFGAGASTVQIDNSVFSGLFTVDTGDGADVLNFDTVNSGGATYFEKAVMLHLGLGADTLNLGGAATSQRITTLSTFSADGGGDADTKTEGTGNTYASAPVFTSFP